MDLWHSRPEQDCNRRKCNTSKLKVMSRCHLPRVEIDNLGIPMQTMLQALDDQFNIPHGALAMTQYLWGESLGSIWLHQVLRLWFVLSTLPDPSSLTFHCAKTLYTVAERYSDPARQPQVLGRSRSKNQIFDWEVPQLRLADLNFELAEPQSNHGLAIDCCRTSSFSPL